MEDASTSQDQQACQRPPEPGKQLGRIVPQNLQGNQSCQQHVSHFLPPESWDNTFMLFEAPDFVPICYRNPWKLIRNDVEGEEGEGTTTRQENIALVHTRGVAAPCQTVGMETEWTKRNLYPDFHVWPPIFLLYVSHIQNSFIEHLLCAKYIAYCIHYFIHMIKTEDDCFLAGKLWQNLNSVLKSKNITLPPKVHTVKDLSSSHVRMWDLGNEGWVPKNWCLQTCDAGEDSWESLGLQGDQTNQS